MDWQHEHRALPPSERRVSAAYISLPLAYIHLGVVAPGGEDLVNEIDYSEVSL
ncbi:MAG: hypothetical protein M3R15_22800 [Acidobacteriota bacterium]|nr:hypothetical protein [Acidobacteriota bacterium]